MAKLEVGTRAPAFTLVNQNGAKVSLKDFAGQRIVLYFYPADDTPGCTKEACQFNDHLKAFHSSDVTVLGVSPNSAESHQKFRKKYGGDVVLGTQTGYDHDILLDPESKRIDNISPL